MGMLLSPLIRQAAGSGWTTCLSGDDRAETEDLTVVRTESVASAWIADGASRYLQLIIPPGLHLKGEVVEVLLQRVERDVLDSTGSAVQVVELPWGLCFNSILTRQLFAPALRP